MDEHRGVIIYQELVEILDRFEEIKKSGNLIGINNIYIRLRKLGIDKDDPELEDIKGVLKDISVQRNKLVVIAKHLIGQRMAAESEGMYMRRIFACVGRLEHTEKYKSWRK